MAKILALLWNGRIGFAALFLLVTGYVAGQNGERARGEANSLRQRIETMQTDKRIAEAASISDRAKAVELEAAAEKQQEALDALRQRINALPADSQYPATDVELDGLYGPRG